MPKASGAPVGETFTVQLNGSPETFHIKPNIFSTRTMRALAAHVKAQKRESRKELLRLLRDEAKGMDNLTRDTIIKGIIESGLNPIVTYEETVQAIQSADGEGLAIVLSLNVDGIENTKKAMEVIDAYPQIFELIAKVVGAGEEALVAAGN